MPTPASSDEVGHSAVNRRVASSNLARGAKILLLLQLVTDRFRSFLFRLGPNVIMRNSHLAFMAPWLLLVAEAEIFLPEEAGESSRTFASNRMLDYAHRTVV